MLSVLKLYAKQDSSDSRIQDEKLHLKAEKEVIFKRKLQFKKKQTQYCILVCHSVLLLCEPLTCMTSLLLSVMHVKRNEGSSSIYLCTVCREKKGSETQEGGQVGFLIISMNYRTTPGKLSSGGMGIL